MIDAFISGILNAIIFLFTKPSVWIVVLLIACVLLVGGIYPGAVYVYPYWQSKVNYVSVGLFDDVPLEGIKTTVDVPSRLLPDAERIYTYKVEFENTTKKDIDLKFTLDKDKTYVSFVKFTELPITEEVKVPSGGKVPREYEFKVDETTRPREPVRFTLRASIAGDKAAKTVILPIDYWSVPVVFIVGAVFAAILMILRLLLRFWIGI